MSDANGRVCGVDRLPTGSGGAEGVDAEILRIDVDLDVVSLRQHGNRGRGGMNAPLLFRGGDALHTVHTALVFELAEDFVAADERNNLAQTADARFTCGGDLHAPASRLRESRVHPEQF